jgi:hypothetical protein
MKLAITFEQWEVNIPRSASQLAVQALCDLGVSVRSWPDGRVTALIRHGNQGAADRLAVVQVELRLSDNPLELKQWLTMCLQLPLHQRARHWRSEELNFDG